MAAGAPVTACPRLVPLSCLWDGRTIVISTAAKSPTSAHLRATGKARVAIGPTRDPVLIEGPVDTTGERAGVPEEVAVAGRRLPYPAVKPPSTGSTAPVTYGAPIR